ncbi:FMN-binding glutamate synthase family protein [Rhodococcus rhodochrous]|uniref:FMN-binding glutamate synthase family protein n=1 Tax=Rhodococcus rhodochrous TaxID=1829 RepID=UPI00132ECA5B|nr:FMN-binding glutamate synthase family protein [Rhodococcus rhodochrous]QHG81676.1 FMN-binding glutamate synthase family protein [Rhodococcus rhodochrous]QOH58647.1 FMN-binding glutamate synthase family protein [Rhodococcus rhodochrous]
MGWSKTLGIPAAAAAAVGAYDLVQKRHSLLRNFPILGHARYVLESLGPELRQYITTNNDEERPFNRDQRRWIYASSKNVTNTFGFGSDNDIEYTDGYTIIKHRTFSDLPPSAAPHGGEKVSIPSAKVLGAARGRARAFRPGSFVNISAMSFGSLSGAAVEALNRGAGAAGCLQNTGEGGLTNYHRNGGELIFQIGTGYFGCRDEDGHFDLARLKRVVESAPIRALEIKLSQGAKPGLGGLLPGAKVTPEIAEVRGIPVGKDCVSPSRHTEFHDIDSLLDWVELLAAETGLPVGIKSAVGDTTFWDELTRRMSETDRGVDFVTIDGGEGGTGAAPLVFADAVSLPFRSGFARVYATFAEAGLTDDVTFIGAGKLGLPDNAVVAMALGCDMVNVAREPMFSIGCIQAQKCHTDRCPTGVATQNRWLTRGLDVPSKADRVADYIGALRRDVFKIAQATGVVHPGLITVDDIEIADGNRHAVTLREMYGYRDGWGLPSQADREEITRLMTAEAVTTPGGTEASTATS